MFSQQAILNEADSLFRLGNYSKAIQLYETIAAPKRSYDRLAQSYQAIGDYNRALSNYELAVENDRENLFLKYDYAKLLRSLKRFDNSKPLFEELIAKDSLNPNFYFEMGKLLEQSKDSSAIKYYNKTYNLDASHQKAIFKIARHKLVKRKHLESIDYADIGLQIYPENVELISLKAQNLYWLEDYEKAIFWFEKLISLGESSELIYEKLSISYYENYNVEKALEFRLKALGHNPYNPDTLFVIGTYYEDLMEFENAEEYVLKSLQIKDISLSYEYQRLGIIFNRQKKYDKAIDAFQKALKEDPDNMTADFFMAMSKDKYYKDIDARIQVFEDLKKKYDDSPLSQIAERRLAELKQEKFNSQD
ncbi:MAG: tetratricopeptide repeat protein [Bacteroidota bacterium]